MWRRPFLFPLALLLAFHLLFFASSLLNPPALVSDSREYLLAAENIYSGGTLYCGDLSEPVREELYTRRPPLYPLIAGLALPAGPVPLRLFQCLLSVLSIFLVCKIFLNGTGLEATGPQGNGPQGTGPLSEIPVGRQARIPVASPATYLLLLFLVLTPAQFMYANLVMAEIPFQLLVVLMAWSFYRWSSITYDGKHSDREPGKYVWFFFLFLTLGMATKPVLFPFALLAMLLSLFLFLKTRQKALWMALCLPLAWLVFYGIRNERATGSVQYSSIQTANMVNYNLRYFLEGREASETAAAEVDRLYEICGQEGSYREKNRCLGREVRKEILDHPFSYGLYHLKGSIRCFFDPGRFDLVTFFHLPDEGSGGFLRALNRDGLGGAVRLLRQQGWGLVVILVLVLLFKLLKITGFLIYLFRGNRKISMRIFLALLIAYVVVVTGPLGASRFLLPVELLLIGGACRGWAPLLFKGSKVQDLVEL